MEMINLGSIAIAFFITILLMVSHYLSPFISRIKGVSEKNVASFAGGVAVSYVFLHMLPELVEGNNAIGEILSQTVHLTPLVDLAIFIVALLGFNIYYGLELLATRAVRDGQGSSARVYRLHIGMYCLHNLLITYTMPLRVQSGTFYSAIFTVAMGLHFILKDRSMNRNFHGRFSIKGRFLLLSSLFLGWFISAITDPINVLAVSLLIAFLSGSILFNVFKEELPSTVESSYYWFSVGLGITAVLLILQTALSSG